MQAIILAGGKGTRLRPITYEIPKPLIPIHNKPVICYLFDLFRRHGITDIILSVGYLKERIRERLGDGREFGVTLRYVEEEDSLGTGGPLRLIKQRRLLPAETFVVANGDELKEVDIGQMRALHHQKKALATIALTQVDNPSAYGVAELDGSRIVRFVEKPSPAQAPSRLINAGLYLLEPAAVDLLPHGPSMLERDLFPRLAHEGRLYGFPFIGQWFDTGSFERYEKAIKGWKASTSA